MKACVKDSKNWDTLMTDKKLDLTDLQALTEKLLENSRDMAKKLPILGNVVWLYQQSSMHRYLFFRDIEHRLMPPLTTDQFKLYLHSKTGGLPIAFVSWAYLSDEAEEAYIETQRIAPSDWRSGKNLWLIDTVSPFAEGAQLFQQVYEELFIDKDVYVLAPDQNDRLQKTSLVELAKNISVNQSKQKSKQATKH